MHVVLDQQHRVILGDALDEIGGAPLALFGHPRRRLVEQQELRVGRDQHADFEPLPLAMRKRVGRIVGLVGEFDEFEDLPDALVLLPASPA